MTDATDYYGEALKAFIANGEPNAELCAALTAQIAESIADFLPKLTEQDKATAMWITKNYVARLRKQGENGKVRPQSPSAE